MTNPPIAPLKKIVFIPIAAMNLNNGWLENPNYTAQKIAVKPQQK